MISDIELKREVIGFVQTFKWEAPYAVTLTFKAGIWAPDGGWLKCQLHDAEKNVRHWLNVVSRRLFRRSHHSANPGLKCVAVKEETDLVRLHYHLMIERPGGWNDAAFIDLLTREWQRTDWGNDQVVVEACDLGWLGYIAKRKTKREYDLSIDWGNTHSGAI